MLDFVIIAASVTNLRYFENQQVDYVQSISNCTRSLNTWKRLVYGQPKNIVYIKFQRRIGFAFF